MNDRQGWKDSVAFNELVFDGKFRPAGVRLSEVTRWHQALHLAALFFPECQLSEWSQWGACVKTSKPCGLKRGTRSRVRRPLRVWDPPSQTCAPQTQRRKCAAPKTPCKRAQGPRPRGGGTVLYFHFHFIDRLETCVPNTRGTTRTIAIGQSPSKRDRGPFTYSRAFAAFSSLTNEEHWLQTRNKVLSNKNGVGTFKSSASSKFSNRENGDSIDTKGKKKKEGFLPFQGFKCPRSCGCRAPV